MQRTKALRFVQKKRELSNLCYKRRTTKPTVMLASISSSVSLRTTSETWWGAKFPASFDVPDNDGNEECNLVDVDEKLKEKKKKRAIAN